MSSQFPYQQTTFLTPKGPAIRWIKPTQWVYLNWREAGLRPIKIGNHLRFRLSEVMEWEVAHQ